MDGIKTIKVGLLGCGTVGGGVAIVLNENREDITRRSGCRIEIAKVLLRNAADPNEIVRKYGLPVTDRIEDIVEDPDIQIVVELMGRIHPAKEYIEAALAHGKNVVTSNKDLIAEYGEELLGLAGKKGVDFQFEGSVGGGIPIIMPLKNCLAANRITSIMGIVNGTTNYMLTRMEKAKLPYAEALKEAQALGYAESDPTADVEGLDAARKIAILASIAFNMRIGLEDVHVEGIDQLEAIDVQYAADLGYAVKLLGIAKWYPKYGVSANVYPVMLPVHHPLASVNDVYNAIYINGDAVGEAMFLGRGAGRLPTASAVCGDIVDTARNLLHGATNRIGCTCYRDKQLCPPDKEMSPCYIRMQVQDKPGVLAAIAAAFGAQQVSLYNVIQKELPKPGQAEIVVVTNNISKLSLELSLQTLRVLPVVDKVCSVLRVEDPRLLLAGQD